MVYKIRPSLRKTPTEELRLDGMRLEVRCAKNLDSRCPRLKRVRLERPFDKELQCEVIGSLEFIHDTLEELDCRGFLLQTKRIACPKLTKLVMRCGIDGPNVELAFLVVESLNLLRLELLGYAHVVCNLPSILAMFMDLESLKIENQRDGWKHAVLEHSRIKDLVLTESKARSLVLIMPSLVHIDIGETELGVLKVASMEKSITVDFHWYSTRLERRRRVFQGGRMRKVDPSDAM